MPAQKSSTLKKNSTRPQTRKPASNANRRLSNANLGVKPTGKTSTKPSTRQAVHTQTRSRGSVSATVAHSKRGRNSHAKRKIFLAIFVFLALLLIADHAMNFNKAYQGVYIGVVDCSGKTQDEIVYLLEQTYGETYEQKEVLVYASKEAQYASTQNSDTSASNTTLGDEDQISVDEARERRQVWSLMPETVAASFNEVASAAQAVQYAHGISNIPQRLACALQGVQLEAVFDFGDAFNVLVAEINETIGTARIDYNITVEQGVCSVTEGQDGYLVNNTEFQKQLAFGFLSQENTPYSFVANVEPAPVRIDKTMAQAVSDQVNNAIADGINFQYEGSGWNATASQVGEWVTSTIVQTGDTYALIPLIDQSVARPALLTHIRENGGEDVMDITFSISATSEVLVHTAQAGNIPLVDDALNELNTGLFGSDNTPAQEGAQAADGVAVNVAIASTEAPAEMSFDDALYYGVVGEITSFTTEYTYGTSSTETRNYNIHLAADLLNNSICPVNGTWSFHNVAGECNEENGFKEAGVIEEGVYSTSFGGGICQVATTVFNAAYEAGYYIDRRYNHTIYNSSYPAGRDAAVSWPDLDLIWSNDTSSDVLLTTSYTEGSLTVTLWGVNPQRSVSTSVSDWEEGDKHKTKYVESSELSPNTYKIKSKGSDGRSITVERTVYSKDSEQLSFQRFNSTYDAVDEIIEYGEGWEVPDDANE